MTRSGIDFSVIVPVRNEERYIGQCLDSLLAQDYSGSYEIIVVDGMSEDSTSGVVSAYSSRDERIRLISNPERITPCAFNHGIRAARGKILLTVGGHWHVPSNYLSHIESVFNKYPFIDCLGGRIVRMANTEASRAIELARASLLGGGLSMRSDPSNDERVVQEPNVAYIWRRHVFDRVGLFDERFVKNQDNEFNMRTLRAGLETLYSPGVVFYYHAPNNLRKLFRQMFGYASYTPMMMLKHRRLLKSSFTIPATGFLVWLILSLLAVIGVVSIIIPVTLLGSYSFIITIASLITSLCAKKLTYWPIIFFVYPVIHIAVSLGYLGGICRLFNVSLVVSLWRDAKSVA